MSAELIEKHRENAEVYTGDIDLCKKKSLELLLEINMPNGLLPMEDMEEVGYNRTTGFVWLKQKKMVKHHFEKIDRHVSYDTYVTAFVEDRKIKKLHGVKAKEMLVYITIQEIRIDDPDSGKITFANIPTGISRTFPISAFEVEEEVKK